MNDILDFSAYADKHTLALDRHRRLVMLSSMSRGVPLRYKLRRWASTTAKWFIGAVFALCVAYTFTGLLVNGFSIFGITLW